ncbi:carph-isopro domain-containing protein [Sulfitobacter sp. W074]|uniref:carph-isopro domain-containing protein n=1 Tax=Sulfitobacter sp. W074 TaxID=2867026 RepID=UPI0038FD3B75
MNEILNIWPTMADLAKDIGKPYSTVAAWKARGKIPADHDFDLIEAAEKRGRALTLEQLAEARRSTASAPSDAA